MHLNSKNGLKLHGKKFSGFIREFHRQKLYDSCWRKHCLFAEQNPYREIGESLSWKMLYQCCFRYVCYFAFHGKKIVLLIVIRLIRKLWIFKVKTKRNFVKNKWTNYRKPLKPNLYSNHFEKHHGKCNQFWLSTFS